MSCRFSIELRSRENITAVTQIQLTINNKPLYNSYFTSFCFIVHTHKQNHCISICTAPEISLHWHEKEFFHETELDISVGRL